MAVPTLTKNRYRILLLITGAILIVAGAATGTILLLKQFGPARVSESTSETATDTTSPLKKAEELFAKGDYAGAKVQYQSILDTYRTQKNEAGAKDIEMQLKVIDATASAETAPQNTDRTRVSAGSQQQ